jgi:sec-independent protein translocase protein TatA
VVNVGPLEIMLVAIIALIVLGPARLPEVARSVGRGMREFRSALASVGEDDREDDDDVDDEIPEIDAETDEDEDDTELPPLPKEPPGSTDGEDDGPTPPSPPTGAATT